VDTVRPILAIAVLIVASASAQGPIQPRTSPTRKQAAVPSANLRVDSSLVLVPVTVNDELNRPVTGLEKENFHIYDDKQEQTITSFSTEDEPIALGLVFDDSGSMGGTLPQGRRAVAQFLGLANPEDEFFLVEFDTKPRLTVPLTADTGGINTEVLFTKSGGSTALFDALYLAINEMHKSKRTKKAIVLISDGGENHSRYTQKELEDLVRESDVLIYTILVPGSDANPALMTRIAEMTGAHGYFAGAVELSDIAQKICVELRNRYVIGYSPHDVTRDGRYHHIEVKLAPPRGLPKLRAHWRLGYYAPSD
jgi:Ca-activated chloride channel homolog